MLCSNGNKLKKHKNKTQTTQTNLQENKNVDKYFVYQMNAQNTFCKKNFIEYKVSATASAQFELPVQMTEIFKNNRKALEACNDYFLSG